MIGAVRNIYPVAADELDLVEADNNLIYHYINRHNYLIKAEVEVRK